MGFALLFPAFDILGADGIVIESATYGGNCGVPEGNATSHIASRCNGKFKCQYTVDHKIIGDPAYGCAKIYTVLYRCGDNPSVHRVAVPKEAGWGDKTVVLECWKTIKVSSATYGENCGAGKGNVTDDIAKQCDGKKTCSYNVDHKVIGDPTFGCAKTYSVEYQCGDNPKIFQESLPAEAGWGDKSITLKCNKRPDFHYQPSVNIGAPPLREGPGSR
jgi:hypothetical protein